MSKNKIKLNFDINQRANAVVSLKGKYDEDIDAEVEVLKGICQNGY